MSISSAEMRKRIAEEFAKEVAEGKQSWYYLSFADDKKGFLGAVVIKAFGLADAMKQCWQLGINPGGSVLSYEIDAGKINLVPEAARNRLLSLRDLVDAGLVDADAMKDKKVYNRG